MAGTTGGSLLHTRTGLNGIALPRLLSIIVRIGLV
jgi:hypothetical protein